MIPMPIAKRWISKSGKKRKDRDISNRLSVVCNVIKNQSSDFSTPLSTPFKVRKGRGSQKEETRCSHLSNCNHSLIELVQDLDELRVLCAATMKMWTKKKPTNQTEFLPTSSDTAFKPFLK